MARTKEFNPDAAPRALAHRLAEAVSAKSPPNSCFSTKLNIIEQALALLG